MNNIGFDTLESFLSLDDNNYEGWKRIKSKCEGLNFIPKAKNPRTHQITAIENTLKHFTDNSRGKIIMPCGTGKSLTAYWIVRKLNVKSVML